MISDDCVSEVCVCAHSGSQSQWKVREGSHYQTPYKRRGRSGYYQVFSGSLQTGRVARVDWGEFARVIRWVDSESGAGAVGDSDGGVGAERGAVGDGARAAGVGEDAGVDGEDVGHGEERGGAGPELGGESGVPLGEFEAFPDAGICYIRV